MLRPLYIFLFSVCVSMTMAQNDQHEVQKADTDRNSELKILKSIDNNIMMMRKGLLPSNCPWPWQSYFKMCLLFNKQQMTWPDAEMFCASKGGFLFWIVDSSEHYRIKFFVESSGYQEYFWIGLHRSQHGPLKWSSDFESTYAGNPSNSSKFFAMNTRNRTIAGMSEWTLQPPLCRRAALSPFTSLNAQFSAVLKKLDKQAAECPQPWKRRRNMCLMYISKTYTWPKAEKLCQSIGGHLIWFENDKEHKFVLSLKSIRGTIFTNWFWTGLHKMNGTFVWSGPSTSTYRGNPFTSKHYNYFSAKFASTQIDGDPNSRVWNPFCRRQLP